MNRFEFKQEDQTITLSSGQAPALSAILAKAVEQAVELVHEQREHLEVDAATLDPDETGPGGKVTLERSDSRLAYAVHIQSGAQHIAFDIGEAWGVRVFLDEAVRQENGGVYDSWV